MPSQDIFYEIRSIGNNKQSVITSNIFDVYFVAINFPELIYCVLKVAIRLDCSKDMFVHV
jgi:hypothetical protein